MSDMLVFKSNALKEVEADYNNLHVTSEQRSKIDSFAKIISKFLPISEIAIRGFIWRVLKEITTQAQVDFRKEAQREDITLDIKMEGVMAFFNMVKAELKKVLVSPEQEPLLNEGIKKALDFYKNSLVEK